MFSKIPSSVKLKKYQALGSVEALEKRLDMLAQYEELGVIEEIIEAFEATTQLIEAVKQNKQWQEYLTQIVETQKDGDETFQELRRQQAEMKKRLACRKVGFLRKLLEGL